MKAISVPEQPSKREREEHEATHAQCSSWCVACVRGRGVAIFRIASVHDQRMHSPGDQQGITVLVVKEMET